MWNTKDLQNSISKQILTLCCLLVVFWNYLSHSQPWDAFEKAVVCCSRWSSWAHSAWQGWDVLWADQQWCGTGRALETLALDWTSAARAMEAVELTGRSPGTPQSCAAGTGASAGGRTPKTALRTFPDCCPSSISDVLYTPSITVTWWLYSPTSANGLFLYYIFNWGLSLWTGSRTRKGLIHSHWCSVHKPPHKPNKTSDKKLDRPTYGNICNCRDLEAQNKMPPAITQGSNTPHAAVALLKPILFGHNCSSFASSKKCGSTKQDTLC